MTTPLTSDEVVGLLRCATCKLLFDPDEEGSTEEVNECGPCGDARAAYELRHAHPTSPTTIAEYRSAKGE